MHAAACSARRSRRPAAVSGRLARRGGDVGGRRSVAPAAARLRRLDARDAAAAPPAAFAISRASSARSSAPSPPSATPSSSRCCAPSERATASRGAAVRGAVRDSTTGGAAPQRCGRDADRRIGTATAGRHRPAAKAQHLSDADQVRILDRVPRRELAIVEPVLERDRVQRVAALHRVALRPPVGLDAVAAATAPVTGDGGALATGGGSPGCARGGTARRSSTGATLRVVQRRERGAPARCRRSARRCGRADGSRAW